MKLTKLETRLHDQAVELLDTSDLQTREVPCPQCGGRTADNFCVHCHWGRVAAVDFILRHWRPGASNNVGKGGIFFTPESAARDAVAFHGGAGRVVDCCAGIGVLARWFVLHHQTQPSLLDLTCVEINPEFVAIGRKLVPQARWNCGNVFDVLPSLDLFDSAISNPPFGNVPACKERSQHFPTEAHFAVMELLLRRCRQGAIMILPEQAHSQENYGRENTTAAYRKFKRIYPEAHITPGPFDPISEGWQGTHIRCQICNLETPNTDKNPYLDGGEPSDSQQKLPLQISPSVLPEAA